MELRVYTGTAEEIAKVLQATKSNEEQDVKLINSLVLDGKVVSDVLSSIDAEFARKMG
ncbi:MAG: hypothetical protein ACLSIL_07910 [Enterococcus casseliflavus]|uniref:hypothetical protein n=1 Tax=Enterococcus casseliflavus TaxID=37734 RepID=UPI002DB7DDF3|nr:hypothetical protein [Enterococcus casseliflavus]MEB8400879.1 hypothetical protein [Enterococcus casseliflavus]